MKIKDLRWYYLDANWTPAKGRWGLDSKRTPDDFLDSERWRLPRCGFCKCCSTTVGHRGWELGMLQ